AAPPSSDIHHLTSCSAGGPTDLYNLRGLSAPRHRLVHHGKLVITVPEPEPVPEPVLATRPQSRTPRRSHERPHVTPGRRYRFTTHRGDPVRRRAGSALLTDRNLPRRE